MRPAFTCFKVVFGQELMYKENRRKAYIAISCSFMDHEMENICTFGWIETHVMIIISTNVQVMRKMFVLQDDVGAYQTYISTIPRKVAA